MTVFLDTVGLVAVWDQTDQWHAVAHVCFTQLLVSRVELITTTHVLLECGNAAARRPYRSAVNRLRKQLEQGNRLVAPTTDDWQTAWLGYENGESDAAGIVDHISFAVMRRYGITTAFTNDKHFRAAGLETMFLICAMPSYEIITNGRTDLDDYFVSAEFARVRSSSIHFFWFLLLLITPWRFKSLTALTSCSSSRMKHT